MIQWYKQLVMDTEKMELKKDDKKINILSFFKDFVIP